MVWGKPLCIIPHSVSAPQLLGFAPSHTLVLAGAGVGWCHWQAWEGSEWWGAEPGFLSTQAAPTCLGRTRADGPLLPALPGALCRDVPSPAQDVCSTPATSSLPHCCGQRDHWRLRLPLPVLRPGTLSNQLKVTQPGREREGVETRLAGRPSSVLALAACPPHLSSLGPDALTSGALLPGRDCPSQGEPAPRQGKDP